MSELAQQVRGLVTDALRVYAGTAAEGELRTVAARLDEPLRVAIAGRVKAGKSTLLNALVGTRLAATDAGECTRIVTWYVDGITYRLTLHPRAGQPRQLPFRRAGGAVQIQLDGESADDVERLVIDWPSPALRTMSLIDTPGMGSAHAEVGRRTESVLAADSAEVDAVIYLMRHMHGDDVGFLETFRDGSLDRRPVNTIAVLARADEVGHARGDALAIAGRIAGRYRDDPRVRALCQTVVPVAGLLAEAAAELRERDYADLTRLAADERIHWLLASADRLCHSEEPRDPPPARRAELLDTLGLYGTRLAITLIAEQRVANAGELSRALLGASGLPELRVLLANQFTARAELLKARSALTALESVLHRCPTAHADRLAHDVERVRAGAHEFAEIALLDQIRDGSSGFTSDERRDAERLLGGLSSETVARLGLPAGADLHQLLRTATAEHARWQRRAEHPATPRATAEAARVVARTLAGIVAAVHERGTPSTMHRTFHSS